MFKYCIEFTQICHLLTVYYYIIPKKEFLLFRKPSFLERILAPCVISKGLSLCWATKVDAKKPPKMLSETIAGDAEHCYLFLWHSGTKLNWNFGTLTQNWSGTLPFWHKTELELWHSGAKQNGTLPFWHKTELELWHSGIKLNSNFGILALNWTGTLALWHKTELKLWHSRTKLNWNFGILAQNWTGTSALWHKTELELWHSGTKLNWNFAILVQNWTGNMALWLKTELELWHSCTKVNWNFGTLAQNWTGTSAQNWSGTLALSNWNKTGLSHSCWKLNWSCQFFKCKGIVDCGEIRHHEIYKKCNWITKKWCEFRVFKSFTHYWGEKWKKKAWCTVANIFSNYVLIITVKNVYL